jgi:hypothetical protein
MVTLTGGGWPANKTLYATECAVGPGISLSEQTCDLGTQQQFQTDANGNVSGQLKMTRSLAVNLGSGLTTRDCAVETCGLVGVVWHGQVGNVGEGISLDFPEGNPIAFATTTDATKPTISIAAPVEGAKIAEHKIVKASYTCSDTGGSGLGSCVGDVAKGSPINTTDLGPHTFVVKARDKAGNLTIMIRHYTVIDVTAPIVVLLTPSNGALYEKGSTVPADYSCADAGTGISICGGTAADGTPIDTTSLGNKTFTVTAVDNAGNTTKVSVTYKVIYPWNGFVGLDDVPVMNPAGLPAGQKLAVVFDIGPQGSTSPTTSAKSTQVNCSTGALMGTSAAATGSTSYNMGTQKYTYLWTTKAAWANTCRQFSIKLKDGTEHVVNFQF